MRILIDCTQIPLVRTGVGLYAEHLLQQISLILQPEDRIYVLVQDDDRDLRDIVDAHQNVSSLVIPSSLFRNRLALAAYEQCMLPWILLYHRIDLVHSLHYTFPIVCPCARVVTIHDMTHSLCPEMHTFGRRVVMSGFARLAMRYAEGVLFVSDSTRKDAERLFGRGGNFRAVTPLAVDLEVFDSIDPESILETLSRLQLVTPYILFVGTLEPRKNISRLVEAFDSLGPQYSDYHLVIAGKLGWHYETALAAIENSPKKERIHRLGYVPSADKPALIAGCDLLVYPSLYEGFGLPALEGMAAGVPVITSNISSLPEVTGNAAILVDPSSVEEIAAAMKTVLSDHIHRERLRKAGREQARRFSWEATARLTYVAYLKLSGYP